jgi:predicted NAD/FAD-binding protein
MKIAIIGSGIAGLGAARALAPRHDVEVFEQSGHIGGHTNTIDVSGSASAKVPVDTGFIIYNERTYPLFSRLIAELGVPTRTTDMSFAASCARCDLEFGSAGLSSLFAQRGRVKSPRHWRLLGEILRFFWLGQQALHDQRAQTLTLGEWLGRKAIAQDAVDHFVIPMGAAIWSTPARQMLEFPAQTFLRFFANHGMLAPVGAPKWRTIVGGSKMYVRALVDAHRLKVQRERRVVRLDRDERGVELTFADGGRSRHDRAVVATHSDQALALLAEPTPDEVRVLGAIHYTPNETWLHTDERFLPGPRARSSWNYHTSDCTAPEPALHATYWMNRLQGLPGPTPYLVTLNPAWPIAPDKVIRRIEYAHPRYDFAALRAQRALPRLQGVRSTYYCGAYFGYGFHEDGLRAGIEAAAALERDLVAARPHTSAA